MGDAYPINTGAGAAGRGMSRPASMQAAVVRELLSRPVSLETVPTPRIEAPDELLLRVEACGICGTDLHILAGMSYRPSLPFVLGHETVGTVVDAGSDAALLVGRRVTMTNFTGCGRCGMCLAGDERLCPDLVSITGVLGSWGGFAGYVRIHAAQALEVPSSLDAVAVASLVDAGATAANSVRVALERSPRRVLLIGAGPIGFLCAELLRRAGVPLDVVHPSPLRREALAAIGHHVVATFDEVQAAYDVVIDCAGVPDVIVPGIARLGPRGEYLLAGYAKTPDLDFAAVARKEGVIRGIRSGRRADLASVIAAAADGSIRIPGISTWPLAAINDALEALRSRSVPGKAVIVLEDEG
jgi:2-desacetyl-2-hydroxyethyl bacteriochlorophyllide A dehydrogenase